MGNGYFPQIISGFKGVVDFCRGYFFACVKFKSSSSTW
ncbi:hypothetical protein ECDEC3F_5204 [Escherichia coli DEC3F]|nr:hypothetical protein ECDEC3F_5204 [Escherichia coli DEC3F]